LERVVLNTTKGRNRCCCSVAVVTIPPSTMPGQQGWRFHHSQAQALPELTAKGVAVESDRGRRDPAPTSALRSFDRLPWIGKQRWDPSSPQRHCTPAARIVSASRPLRQQLERLRSYFDRPASVVGSDPTDCVDAMPAMRTAPMT
jgi:hypothetical protein